MKKWLIGIRRNILIATVTLIIFIIFFSVFAIKIKLDIAMILFGLGFLGLVYILYIFVDHKIKPKKTITIISRINLTSPPRLLNSIMTYKLSMSVTHQIEDKGESKQINVDEINLTFNKKDHPDVYNYCLRLIQKETIKNLAIAESMYPNSNIVKGNIELPSELIDYKAEFLIDK